MTWIVNIVESSLAWIADRVGIAADLRGLVVLDQDILSDLEYGRS